MPNYFLRVVQDEEVLQDDDTTEEFVDLAAARLCATDSVRQILSEAVLAGTAGSINTRIEVQDGAGKPLFSVRCGHVVDSDTQG